MGKLEPKIAIWIYKRWLKNKNRLTKVWVSVYPYFNAFDSLLIQILETWKYRWQHLVIILALKFIGLLQLIGILVFAIVILLWFDRGIHTLFFNFSTGQVQVRISFMVCVQGSFWSSKCLFIFLLSLGQ